MPVWRKYVVQYQKDTMINKHIVQHVVHDAVLKINIFDLTVFHLDGKKIYISLNLFNYTVSYLIVASNCSKANLH